MKKSSFKKGLTQALVVLGLSALVLTVFGAFGNSAFAQMINPGDNPDVLAGQTNNAGDIREIVLTIVNFALGFLGLVAVIMVIFGGVTYVTAGGKEEAVGKAKKIIMYAIIGIVVILISFALINTILGAATGGNA